MLIKKLLLNFGDNIQSTIVVLTETINDYTSSEAREQRRLSKLVYTGRLNDPYLETDILIEELKITNGFLSSFLKDSYGLSKSNPIPLEEDQSDIWVEMESYNKEWSEYNLWLYQDILYGVDTRFSRDRQRLMVLDFVDDERQKFERLAAKFSQEQTEHIKYERTRIPENVRIEVWRRDQGKCAGCGSREKLEYDHIVPISRGGSNTARNVELLCEMCNRSKGDRIQ